MAESGLEVRVTREWPDDHMMVGIEAVIIHVVDIDAAPMVAARLRAKPKFGLRLLIALVAVSASSSERRSAVASGFDDVMSESCEGRALTARILRALRRRTDLQCKLPAA